MLHYGLFYLHGSRHNPLSPPPHSAGGGPRGPSPRFTARSAATIAAVVLCLGGAGYAAASQDGDSYGSDPVKAQPQGDAKADSHSRPGRLGAGPLR